MTTATTTARAAAESRNDASQNTSNMTSTTIGRNYPGKDGGCVAAVGNEYNTDEDNN